MTRGEDVEEDVEVLQVSLGTAKEPVSALVGNLVKSPKFPPTNPSKLSVIDGLRSLLLTCSVGRKAPSIVNKRFSLPSNLNGKEKITKDLSSRTERQTLDDDDIQIIEEVTVPTLRRSARRQSLQKVEIESEQKVVKNAKIVENVETVKNVQPPKNPEDAKVILSNCDYKLFVSRQFNFKLEPSKADQRNLIRNLQKLQKTIEKKLAEKPIPPPKTNQVITISSVVTAPPRMPKLKRQLQCKLCSKKFPNQRLLHLHRLTTHMTSKGRKRPHKCQLCGKSFFTQSHLYGHIRIHMGETPFKCDICGDSFTQSGQLFMHKKRHDKDIEIIEKKVKANFKCGKCGKIFPSYLERRRHMRNNHYQKRQLYRCARCGRCCSSIRLLKLHYLKRHTN